MPTGDYRAFVDQVHDFFALPRYHQIEEGHKARKYVLREYSWDKSASQYAEIFAGERTSTNYDLNGVNSCT